MYPTVNALMGLWKFVIAEKVSVVPMEVSETVDCLRTITVEKLFLDITLSEPTGTNHLQWWRKRLVLYGWTYPRGPYYVYDVRISGSNGIVSGPVLLFGKTRHRTETAVEFALSRNTIVMPEGPDHSMLNLWHYPKGGKPYKLLNKRPRDYSLYGVALSIAPTH